MRAFWIIVLENSARCAAGTLVIHEGGTTGHLYVLIEGRLEVIKAITVVASSAGTGAVVGENVVLLDQPHTATVRAASNSTIYEFSDAASFLREQPAVALLIARCLLSGSMLPPPICRHHATICGSRRHLAMVGESPAEHDQPAADKVLARFGSAIRPKDVSHAGGSATTAADACNGALRSMHCSSPGPLTRRPCRVDIEHNMQGGAPIGGGIEHPGVPS